MERKPKRQLKDRSAVPVKLEIQSIIELSSDESGDDIPLHYIKAPPKPPLKECSTDIQPNSATTHDPINNDRLRLERNNTTKANLVVYTTRLDDMHVVSCNNHVDDPVEFYSKILAESKPKVTVDSFKRRVVYDKKKYNPMSFLTLKYKIDRINVSNLRKMVKCIRQKQHTGMLKLETALRLQPPGSEFINRFTKIITDLVNANKPESSNNTEIVNKTVEDIVQVTKLYMQGITYHNNNFIFTNTKTNESEVYYVNEKGMVNKYYQTEDNMHNDIERTLETVEIPYCCWHQRNVFVNLMRPFLPAETVKYLHKSHSCRGQCSCCCENNIGLPIKSRKCKNSEIILLDETPEEPPRTDVEINAERIVTPVPFKVLIKNMLNSLQESNLIHKAFVYTPQKRQKLKTPKVKGSNTFKNIQILFNYDIGNDYYRLGPEGEIEEYLRNVSQTFINEFYNSRGRILNKKVCCLVARNKLTHMFRKNNMLLDTWKFIKTRHRLLDKWKSCCKPFNPIWTTSNASLKEPMLRDIPNCTSEVCNKIPPLKFIFAKHDPIAPDDLVRTRANSATDILAAQMKMASSKKSPIRNDVKAYKRDMDIIEINENEAERRRLICSNTKVLLQNHLIKLQNININVTPKGKITATLNIPVTKLSRDELKILSTVLNEAQKNIDFPRKQVPRGNILNKPAANVAVASKTHERSDLYAAFSSWSHTHNDVYLKSLKSLMKMRDYKINFRSVDFNCKTRKAASASLEMTPRLGRKRRNSATHPSHISSYSAISEELPPKRRTYRKKVPVIKEEPVESHEIYIEPEMESLQLLGETRTTLVEDVPVNKEVPVQSHEIYIKPEIESSQFLEETSTTLAEGVPVNKEVPVQSHEIYIKPEIESSQFLEETSTTLAEDVPVNKEVPVKSHEIYIKPEIESLQLLEETSTTLMEDDDCILGTKLYLV